MWKCRWNIRWRKMWAFFRLNVCIGFRVSSTFGQSDGCMSDTPETMGGLSGVPNGTSSQTSASRGYVLLRGAHKGHTQKSYKLSSGMRTWPAECSKLGKTRIIEDANIRLVRNTTFFEPNFPLHFHLKSHCVIFWSYYLSNQSTICLLRQFLLFSASRIKFGITHIKVTAVEIVLNHPKSLAEALEVDNLPLT